MKASSPSSTPSEPPRTAAELLARKFPPLLKYCPILSTVSAPQTAFLVLDQREAFYGGAAGGGKSAALLMAALQFVDVPGYRAVILRRTYAQLAKGDALIALADEWLALTDARRSDEGKKWTFPSGATIEFGHVQNEADKHDYQGAAYHFVGFDELTQFSETIYTYIAFSRQRRRTAIQQQGVPVRVRSTANPGGVGHGWVKGRFVDPATRKESAVFVPAKVSDNPGLDVADYISSLQELDDVTRSQLLDGDWDVAEGLAFRVEPETLIGPFDPPRDWLRFESLDHGLANPTCVLAWATDYEGNVVIFDSYYSPRNQMISQHAAALAAKRETWWPRDDHDFLEQTIVCYADHDLWGKTGGETNFGDPATLLTEYAARGVEGFTQANKDPKAGRARLMELLKVDPDRPFPAWHHKFGQVGSPRLFIVASRCRELVDQLRVAPTNPEPVGQKHGAGEIVDPKTEGRDLHAVASARYGAMSWTDASEEPARTLDPGELPPIDASEGRASAVRRMVEQQAEADAEVDEYTYV